MSTELPGVAGARCVTRRIDGTHRELLLRAAGLILSGLLLDPNTHLQGEPVPHRISELRPQPDGSPILRLDGSVSGLLPLSGTVSNQFLQMCDLYPVEASVDLSNWIGLAWLLRPNTDPEPLWFQDGAKGLSQRFYRTPTNHLLTAFPKPGGQFAVGIVDRVLRDPTRTNLYRYLPRTNAFMATIWYPADSPPAGTLPAPLAIQGPAVDPGMYTSVGFNPQWATLVAHLVGHRFHDLPLAAGTTRLPVILYSHGLSGYRQAMSQRAEELASRGYVFIGMDHTDCWATVFPDGRRLIGGREDVSGRLKDLQFLLDELTELNTSDPRFAGRLDLDRIGVLGGSVGGMVVETCRRDSRVKCAAVYDATNLRLHPDGLQKPLLTAVGEQNVSCAEELWLFGKAVTNAVFFQIRGADHYTTCDIGWTVEIPWGRAPALAYTATLVWFFDTYLKDQTPPFPANAEIYNLQRK